MKTSERFAGKICSGSGRKSKRLQQKCRRAEAIEVTNLYTTKLPALLLLFILLGGCTEYKMFEAAKSERIANYQIRGRFIPQTHTIRGRETLEWTNTTNTPARELRFHLYMNAFKDSSSTFWQEAGAFPPELKANPGYCLIKLVLLEDFGDVTDDLVFIQPDDDNIADQTVAALPLRKPLQPGESITVRLEFETVLPPLLERAGYREDFHIAAQWYPKIGVYTDDGWRCHQYHANSEFFADFGVYDVVIAVPRNYEVGATGVLRNIPEPDEGYKSYRFYAEDVHDFTWVADTDFHEVRARAKDLRIRLLMQPEHSGEVTDRVLAAVQHGYKFFSRQVGPYPYPILTVVDSPVFGGVMEYPTIFFTGNFDGYRNPPAPDEAQPVENLFMERLTLHELAHQWFYGMSANDEAQDAWMDEGLTEYITARAFEAKYGKIMQPDPNGKPLPVRHFRLDRYQQNPAQIVMQPSWKYPTFGEYYIGSYVKPKLLLHSLDNHLGGDTIPTVIRKFFKRWRFKHPAPRDFLAILEDVAGSEATHFIRHSFETPAYLDYRVESVDKQLVAIARDGEAILPVAIRFLFRDGSEALEEWGGETALIQYDFSGKPPLTVVHIDPEYILEHDIDRTNNVWELVAPE